MKGISPASALPPGTSLLEIIFLELCVLFFARQEQTFIDKQLLELHRLYQYGDDEYLTNNINLLRLFIPLERWVAPTMESSLLWSKSN